MDNSVTWPAAHSYAYVSEQAVVAECHPQDKAIVAGYHPQDKVWRVRVFWGTQHG